MARVLKVQTERLRIRPLNEEDAPFILELLNEPSFIRNIGDRGVRTIAEARLYIANGPMASYSGNGFGLFLVQLTNNGAAIGICGFLKRDTLEHADLGFAFLPRYWSQGYAREAATAVMEYGWSVLGFTSIAAITAPDNISSIRLLEKLGFRYQATIELPNTFRATKLFLINAPARVKE